MDPMGIYDYVDVYLRFPRFFCFRCLKQHLRFVYISQVERVSVQPAKVHGPCRFKNVWCENFLNWMSQLKVRNIGINYRNWISLPETTLQGTNIFEGHKELPGFGYLSATSTLVWRCMIYGKSTKNWFSRKVTISRTMFPFFMHISCSLQLRTHNSLGTFPLPPPSQTIREKLPSLVGSLAANWGSLILWVYPWESKGY